MVRITIELNEHYDSRLKKIAKVENRKKVEEIRHLIDREFVFLGLRRDEA